MALGDPFARQPHTLRSISLSHSLTHSLSVSLSPLPSLFHAHGLTVYHCTCGRQDIVREVGYMQALNDILKLVPHNTRAHTL